MFTMIPWEYITIIPWARVGYEVTDNWNNQRARSYNHFISNKGEWNNCFSKFSNRVLPPIFISTILRSVRKENLAYYFPYDVKLRLLARSRSFLANQKARNAIVGVENLLNLNIFVTNADIRKRETVFFFFHGVLFDTCKKSRAKNLILLLRFLVACSCDSDICTYAK